jgi:hypothetical protein
MSLKARVKRLEAARGETLAQALAREEEARMLEWGETVFIPLLEARVAEMEAREREAGAQGGEPRTCPKF